MNTQKCAICNNTAGNTVFSFRDLHFGTNVYYKYFQCVKCQCLQKCSTDENHVQYYPDNYYSYARDDRLSFSSKVKWMTRDIRNEYYRNGKGVIGNWIHIVLPSMSVAMIERANPEKSMKILDVGCGSDALMLQYLSSQGFVNVFGVDPYITHDINIGQAIILKKRVQDIQDKFDIITLNHSFEHMVDQYEVLSHCKKILTENGRIILRIPTVSSYAWESFKEYWPNLDAPRHLFLHSDKSIKLLINTCGLKVEKNINDSTAFQFWGAELYKKGFALHQKTPFFKYIKLMYRIYYSITKRSIVEKLNANHQGDTVALFLKYL